MCWTCPFCGSTNSENAHVQHKMIGGGYKIDWNWTACEHFLCTATPEEDGPRMAFYLTDEPMLKCDRCGELDQASLGSDEHGLDCGYVVLCEACRTNIADAQEDAREQAAPLPHLAQRDAGLPLTRARGWRKGGYRYGD